MEQLELYPIELYGLVQPIIGPFQIITNYRPKSSRTGIWKLRSNIDNKYYYLKTYTRKQRWHPEVYAYNNWVNHLKPYVPEMIKAFEGDGWQAILITSIDGTIMRETILDSDAVEGAYRKAGELTRSIHNSRIGEWFGRPDKYGSPIELYHHRDPVNYVNNSIRDIANKCIQEGLLESSEVELLEWAFQNMEIFEHTKPVPISWDSTSGNWLVDKDGIFTGMIDFENMLWCIDVDNFSILFERYFTGNGSAMKAFFKGYGLEVLKEKNIQIKICCIKMGIGDIYWGTHNNSPKVREYGRNLMNQIYNNKLINL
ncbi:aminoglycoside phosphotransferase family protein [Paenibacillus polymyxa]|uniref:aminoglycoside phosphotransferase family protein n=1 Tax=Paenibacillus polymyxa TaxID=1406 RepID=UPI0008FC42F2|nr:aminoglycoside phosphotransferase family protein [Paenibacillus polymyxa]APB70303.1 aminoglycoside phosphotransferase family protein [Paenibacillus polymyxa]